MPTMPPSGSLNTLMTSQYDTSAVGSGYSHAWRLVVVAGVYGPHEFFKEMADPPVDDVKI